jgi:uncharacterized protein (TIGR03086 family)
MTASTDPVELLERAIGYTRGTLAGVRDGMLGRPTPCAGWTLGDLLAHMSDGLDAFTEASRGVIAIDPAPATQPGVDVLRDKACRLLGAWTHPHATEVRLGPARVESAILLHAGALEITVHGWDVGQATGGGAPIPEPLAAALLAAAPHLITRADRPSRFAPPTSVTGGSPPSALLLSFTGRHSALSASQPGLGA